MQRRLFLFGLFLVAGLSVEGCSVSRAAESQSVVQFRETVRPLLTRLCSKCHGAAAARAELRIETLDPDLINGPDAETWHDILNRLNLGEMPPVKAAQPSRDERGLIVAWLTRAIREAAAEQRYAGGRVIMRRLTRYEYQNTMRDLLGVNLNFAAELPPEPISPDGFLNNGAALEMSPVQIEACLAAARRGLAEAIVIGPRPGIHHFNVTQSAVGKLPNRKAAGQEPANPEFLADLKTFPRTGDFEIRLRAGAVVPPGHDFPRLRVSLGCVPGIVHVPRKIVAEVDVTAPVDSPQTFVFRGRMEDFPQPGDVPFGNVAFDGMIALVDFLDADGNELRSPDRSSAVSPAPDNAAKPVTAASQAEPAEPDKPTKPELTAKPDKPTKSDMPTKPGNSAKPGRTAKKAARQQAVRRAPDPPPVPEQPRLGIVVESFEFTAPVFANWPPESHRKILLTDEFPDSKDDEPRRVRAILQRFMTRAFRRPVATDELNDAAALFAAIRPDSPTFEEAIREVLASILISPHFLYIVETREPSTVSAAESSTAGSSPSPIARDSSPLSDHELATRLSYFLWSSMPDEPLLALAAAGRLHDPATLADEVERLLRDPRSNEFATRFAEQWFDLEALDRVAVNPDFYPDFDDGLKREMRRQSLAFFAELLRHDQSCLSLIDSDWTMLNRPLARHYGLAGPRSSVFERVALTGSENRGGILGQGSFLLGNSNGETSHPIKRAVWILDRLLDSPPAPPPPDVPELDAESPDLAGLTLKEQLAVHRTQESCSNCHRGIDPWGVPLENFDAVGLWRLQVAPETRRGKRTRFDAASEPRTIDASSELPDGTALNGLPDLKRYLLTHRREQFARSIIKQLMTYSLGRSVDLGDQATIARLSTEFASDNFRLRPLIIALATSEPFRSK